MPDTARGRGQTWEGGSCCVGSAVRSDGEKDGRVGCVVLLPYVAPRLGVALQAVRKIMVSTLKTSHDVRSYVVVLRRVRGIQSPEERARCVPLVWLVRVLLL